MALSLKRAERLGYVLVESIEEHYEEKQRGILLKHDGVFRLESSGPPTHSIQASTLAGALQALEDHLGRQAATGEAASIDVHLDSDAPSFEIFAGRDPVEALTVVGPPLNQEAVDREDELNAAGAESEVLPGADDFDREGVDPEAPEAPETKPEGSVDA